ncbi:hypothetical protein HK096_003844 [Nowakowskiella sp. JEL0078]|nr:hypothetical protein HK096_003844 [Nowakowskiella sp. JEL0078]
MGFCALNAVLLATWPFRMESIGRHTTITTTRPITVTKKTTTYQVTTTSKNTKTKSIGSKKNALVKRVDSSSSVDQYFINRSTEVVSNGEKLDPVSTVRSGDTLAVILLFDMCDGNPTNIDLLVNPVTITGTVESTVIYIKKNIPFSETIQTKQSGKSDYGVTFRSPLDTSTCSKRVTESAPFADTNFTPLLDHGRIVSKPILWKVQGLEIGTTYRVRARGFSRFMQFDILGCKRARSVAFKV